MNDRKNLNPKIHFKNLNELRCIAVLLVIIYHVEQSKYSFGLANVLELKSVVRFGRIGVLLFFVLSGFLNLYIT